VATAAFPQRLRIVSQRCINRFVSPVAGPDSVVEVEFAFNLRASSAGFSGIEIGNEIIVLAWWHRARRNVHSAEPSCCPLELEVRACLEGFS
jgi:tRNA (Thr-GGU) A37 N-methylase